VETVMCLKPIGTEEQRKQGRVLGKTGVSHTTLCALYEPKGPREQVSLLPVIKEGCCYSCKFVGR